VSRRVARGGCSSEPSNAPHALGPDFSSGSARHRGYRMGMRSRISFALLIALLLLLPCSQILAGSPMMSTIHFRKGAGSAETLFNLSSKRFYDGAGSSKTLLTISGDRVYEGAGTAKTLLTVRDGRVYEGAGTAKTLYTIKDGRVYEGAGTAKTLYTSRDRRLYEGAGTAKTLMNWDGGLSEIEFAAAVWLWTHRF